MVLWIHSDASYLSKPKAKSRYGGHHFLGSDQPTTDINGPILALAKILRSIMSSAAEAELAGVFYNAKAATPTRITLVEMGHPQPPTKIETDNSTAVGIVNKTTKHKMSKAMDMKFYWLRCREAQKQFKVSWRAGNKNIYGDFYTKHHPVHHHRVMRGKILNHND